MSKYEIMRTTKFKSDYKNAVKRGCDVSKLHKVISILSEGDKLPEECRDHMLTGNYAGYRECHTEPDWLLAYKVYKKELVLYLYRTGWHSDLFK